MKRWKKALWWNASFQCKLPCFNPDSSSHQCSYFSTSRRHYHRKHIHLSHHSAIEVQGPNLINALERLWDFRLLAAPHAKMPRQIQEVKTHLQILVLYTSTPKVRCFFGAIETRQETHQAPVSLPSNHPRSPPESCKRCGALADAESLSPFRGEVPRGPGFFFEVNGPTRRCSQWVLHRMFSHLESSCLGRLRKLRQNGSL